MIFEFGDKKPSIAKSAFVAETASIIGDVVLGENSSVWFNSVIRGDRARIRIGKGSNVQDNSVIHSDEHDVEIGDEVTIGHGSVIHCSRIKDNALIGMNSTILHDAEIGTSAIVGAGALVPPGFKVPDNSVVLGVPCRIIRTVTEEDIELMKHTLINYKKLTAEYLKMKR